MSVIILLGIIAVLWIWDEMRSAPTIDDKRETRRKAKEKE